MCFRACNTFRSWTIIGSIVIAVGGLLLIVWPIVFSAILNKQLILSPQSQSYALWKVIPVPIYMEFYLFNWTNPNDIHTEKPILEELGPYVFREHREKVIADWFQKNKTVTFKQNRTWIFEPELSNGSLDDLVTTLNVPAVTAAYSLRDMSKSFKAVLDLFFFTMRTKHFVTKKAREFIFEGYSDAILDIAHFKPGAPPFDKFGWMYARNGSADYDGIYNMGTEADDLGIVKNWNYENFTRFYESPCSLVSGSAGELFPPGRHGRPFDHLEIFSSDICRSIRLNYKEDTTVAGIQAARYLADDLIFANKTTVANNWCFCGDGGETCYPDGVLNVTTCKWGAPAFISFPHFYNADPSYREAVVGMNPQSHLHPFVLDLEPVTGIPLNVSAGFQINILLQPQKSYSLLKKMPKIYFPMVWFRQVANVDDDISSELRGILLLSKLGLIISYIFLSLGLSILAILAVVYFSIQWKRDDEALYLVSQRPQQPPS